MMKTIFDIVSLLDRRRKAVALGILALLVIGSFLEAVSISLVLPLILILTSSSASKAIGWEAMDQIAAKFSENELVILAIGVVLAFFFLKNLFFMLVVWFQGRFVFGLQAALSEQIFDRYLDQTFEEQVSGHSSHLIRDVTTEVQYFTAYAALPMMGILTELPIIVALGVVLFVLQPLGALLTVVSSGVMIAALYILLSPRLAHWGNIRQEAEVDRVKCMQQTVNCFSEIKLRRDSRYFLSYFSEYNRSVVKMAERINFWQAFPRYWIEFFLLISILLLVAYLVMSGSDSSVTVSTLGVFAAVAFKLAPSANRVVAHVQALRYAQPVVEILATRLTAHWRVRAGTSQTPISVKTENAIASWKELIIRNVTYQHEGAEAHSLRRVNFTIKRGSVVGFVGPSGAGKTTLANVIMGLLAPSEGGVFLDGLQVNPPRAEFPDLLSAWQRNIGYVPQNFALIDSSIRQNIAFRFREEEIEEAAISRAIAGAEISEFVQSLPQGADTIVGERGIRLSGGQGQRIAIARSLYLNAGLIVFDEATSALDDATQGAVIESLLEKRGAKTIIIIAHRTSTLQLCDEVIELNKGEVRRIGTPIETLDALAGASNG
ncbi:ABC transporter ATP-binding protein [Pseudolabrys sp.]|uniref:ABC transporter ATP-binding protein n=1 Tax=Pseudolabrys sp. TaxID=1960880 RepID=UPI003D0FB50B